MALAACIFGGWNPLKGLGASFLFSFTDAIQMRMQTSKLRIATELVQMIPYILTILILAAQWSDPGLLQLWASTTSRADKQIGLSFFRFRYP